MDDSTKAVIAVLASSSISGLGVHGLHSSQDDVPINSLTAEQCSVFINHEQRHKDSECNLEKIRLQLLCKDK